MHQTTETSVVILEDEGLFRSLLRDALDREPTIQVIGEFSTAESALEMVPKLRPDVILLDIELEPGMNGMHLGLHLRQELPELGIVLLTDHADPHILASVPQPMAGGWSYLLKRSVTDIDVLCRVIEGTSAGYVVLDQMLLTMTQARDESILSRLTPRQAQILALIAEGYTNAAIAEKLVLSEKSVQNHINSLYQQLGLDRSDGSVQPRVTAALTYLRETRTG